MEHRAHEIPHILKPEVH